MDRQLRVRGVEGVRVVDASVMPSVPRSNTNWPGDRPGRASRRPDLRGRTLASQQAELPEYPRLRRLSGAFISLVLGVDNGEEENP